MKFSQLKNVIECKKCNIPNNIEITNIAYDSREVCDGSLFVAIRGEVTDGHKYIQSAIQKGAVAIVCEAVPEQEIPYILVEDSRKALALMSKEFFNNAVDKMKILGITGTNGKTTTTYLIKQILESKGLKVGLIGTNQNMIGDEVLETERTTPESFELHKLFAQMLKEGCQYVIMEVSSHSLVLDRVYGINFEVGAFTNLTQDHLDFHGSMENYRDAKAMLFERSNTSVINYDDKVSTELIKHVKDKLVTYSTKCDKASVIAHDVKLTREGISYKCLHDDELIRVSLAIPGEFSVYNSLCALSVCMSVGISLTDGADVLETAKGVMGRAEVVPVPTDYTVLIDYAHSEDGIINILNAVKGFAKARIISVFGCGGDRDKTKRPKMGKAAAQRSDLCIITSDNPRTEDAQSIIDDILVGLVDVNKKYEVVVDRREAIKYALSIAKKDDIIVFMGKGHETYQEINHVKHHLDEREEIANYFK